MFCDSDPNADRAPKATSAPPHGHRRVFWSGHSGRDLGEGGGHEGEQRGGGRESQHAGRRGLRERSGAGGRPADEPSGGGSREDGRGAGIVPAGRARGISDSGGEGRDFLREAWVGRLGRRSGREGLKSGAALKKREF